MKKTAYYSFIYLILVLVSITMLVPFLWMFLTAFKTVAETMQVDPFVIVPKVWQTQNFGNVVKAMDFRRLYANTLAMVALRIFFAIDNRGGQGIYGFLPGTEGGGEMRGRFFLLSEQGARREVYRQEGEAEGYLP